MIMKKKPYHAVIGAAFSSEVKWFVVVDAFVDDSIGEHGLGGDAEDEDSERQVFRWFRLSPHF